MAVVPVKINPQTGKLNCIKCTSPSTVRRSDKFKIEEHFATCLVSCLKCGKLFEEIRYSTAAELIEAYGDEKGLEMWSEIPVDDRKVE